MRIFSLFISSIIIVALCALIMLLSLVIETEPHIVRSANLTPEHIERAKKMIDAHRQQASLRLLSRLNFLPSDIDIALNYLANFLGKGNAQTVFSKHQVQIYLTFPIPVNFISGYLNLAVTMVQTKDLPRIQSVRIGKLSLPDSIANYLLSNEFLWSRMNPEYRKGLDTIKFVYISAHRVSVLYRWNKNAPKLKGGILTLDEHELTQLLRYQTLLADIKHQNNGKAISLTSLLQPLMKLAAEQSINGGAQSENRAMLLVATLHVLNIPIKVLIPAAETWPRPESQLITLNERNDFAKHFMVSAVISAYADTSLANAIGLYKEIEDARSGSGFSFDDIIADRAGTTFGARAVASEIHALKLQKLLAAGLEDMDLMPFWSDLPESMPESEFKQRFGGIDSAAYQRIIAEIERRVLNLPFAN